MKSALFLFRLLQRVPWGFNFIFYKIETVPVKHQFLLEAFTISDCKSETPVSVELEIKGFCIDQDLFH